MAAIPNTAAPPDVDPGEHDLEIVRVEAIQGIAFGDPSTPETRIRMTLQVITAEEPPERFPVWFSAKLSPKAAFGALVRVLLGGTPTDKTFELDSLVGKRFRCRVGLNDRGYLRLDGDPMPLVEPPS